MTTPTKIKAKPEPLALRFNLRHQGDLTRLSGLLQGGGWGGSLNAAPDHTGDLVCNVTLADDMQMGEFLFALCVLKENYRGDRALQTIAKAHAHTGSEWDSGNASALALALLVAFPKSQEAKDWAEWLEELDRDLFPQPMPDATTLSRQTAGLALYYIPDNLEEQAHLLSTIGEDWGGSIYATHARPAREEAEARHTFDNGGAVFMAVLPDADSAFSFLRAMRHHALNLGGEGMARSLCPMHAPEGRNGTNALDTCNAVHESFPDASRMALATEWLLRL